MGGIQIENLLNLMEGTSPFNPVQARREVLKYLTSHMVDVATELEEKWRGGHPDILRQLSPDSG